MTEPIDPLGPEAWRGRKVLLTGHTGFKGGWLGFLLTSLGAEVTGYSLEQPDRDAFYHAVGESNIVSRSVIADLDDREALRRTVSESKPEVVFHLAAQTLVRASYADPVETYRTNVMGTAHVLDATRAEPSVRAVVAITTDKCYSNKEQIWPYRETDPMGGHDPYSSSKGACELLIDSFRKSFFEPAGIGLASGRAGNVIGGGDWSADRLVPDCLRAARADELVDIRMPHAVRPWQHVTEPVAGYLVLAQRLLANPGRYSEGYNFGPAPESIVSVGEVVESLLTHTGGKYRIRTPENPVHEATLLALDCTKARVELGWSALFDVQDAVRMTAQWHQELDKGGDMAAVTAAQWDEYRSRR